MNFKIILFNLLACLFLLSSCEKDPPLEETIVGKWEFVHVTDITTNEYETILSEIPKITAYAEDRLTLSEDGVVTYDDRYNDDWSGNWTLSYITNEIYTGEYDEDGDEEIEYEHITYLNIYKWDSSSASWVVWGKWELHYDLKDSKYLIGKEYFSDYEYRKFELNRI